MIKRDYDTLAAHVDAFSGSDLAVFSDTCKILLEAILVSAFEDETNRDQYLDLIEKIRVDTDTAPNLLSEIIGNIGLRCYQLRSPALAEWIYRHAMHLYDSPVIRNNLAYILRRHRDDLCASDVEIMDLLMNGVRDQDSFSLINMALHFALNLGTDDDWRLADRLIRLVNADVASSAYLWWHDLAAKEEPEGILLLYWLNRHSKIPFPLDDAGASWIPRITDCYSGIPQWFFQASTED